MQNKGYRPWPKRLPLEPTSCSNPPQVSVIGAGPAGCSAALSAIREGAHVDLYDQAAFPRHKVCGEFLSPEAVRLLDSLGVWEACENQLPATLRRVLLFFGKRSKEWALSEPARGLSRFTMDRVLLEAAIRRGVQFHRETKMAGERAVVLAYGRRLQAARGNRLFGFKAHFTGPMDDAMSLFFFRNCYVGVNAVENGSTNVCGIAPEEMLRGIGFKVDRLLTEYPPLRQRVALLIRSMDWLVTGPLVFGPSIPDATVYPAGDALAFIDPFTGSGMLGAISTGILAGTAAAKQTAPAQHRKACEYLLKRQYQVAGLLRVAIQSGWAEHLLPFVPGKLLFHLTRPQKVE